ncbi:MAG: YezD family protein [Methylacidiphilales bacterium]|nr:YezD family protein [Candidatus Methylacidiphilales bacterium]
MSQKIDFIEQPAKIKPKNLATVPDEAEIVRRILRALANLDYGSVEIIVQDSKVVQIERTQRSRFSPPLEIPKAD